MNTNSTDSETSGTENVRESYNLSILQAIKQENVEVLSMNAAESGDYLDTIMEFINDENKSVSSHIFNFFSHLFYKKNHSTNI